MHWITDIGWIMGPWLLAERARPRADGDALRRRARLPRRRPLLAARRAPPRDVPRRVADADPRARGRRGDGLRRRRRPLAPCGCSARRASPGTRSRGCGSSSASAAAPCRSSTSRAAPRSRPRSSARRRVMPLKPCSLGGPRSAWRWTSTTPAGAPLRGEVGELVCTQPWPGMTRGFWGDPERYLETYWSRFPGVWTHGDWASVDADGDWFLHGRSDDTINIAGKRIGPAEYESALVGDPGRRRGLRRRRARTRSRARSCGASACCAPGSEPDEELRTRLRERCAEALGKAFAPAEIRFTTALPKTRSAKILRRAVRATVLGDDPGDLSTLEDPGAIDAVRESVEPRYSSCDQVDGASEAGNDSSEASSTASSSGGYAWWGGNSARRPASSPLRGRLRHRISVAHCEPSRACGRTHPPDPMSLGDLRADDLGALDQRLELHLGDLARQRLHAAIGARLTRSAGTYSQHLTRCESRPSWASRSSSVRMSSTPTWTSLSFGQVLQELDAGHVAVGVVEHELVDARRVQEVRQHRLIALGEVGAEDVVAPGVAEAEVPADLRVDAVAAVPDDFARSSCSRSRRR